MKIRTLTLFLAGLGFCCAAYAGLLGFGGTSWKEEVLLRDGSKIVVERTQTYGGSREIGQPKPVKEHSVTFSIPGSSSRITWKSEYGEDIKNTNFKLLALHVLNKTPYIVAVPALCLSYNKWGRPNPPYVIFKYEGKEWKRISLQELPIEFKEINLVIATLADEKIVAAQSLVSAELVKKLNGSLEQPEYHSILREPVKPGAVGSIVNCPDYNSPRYMSPKAPNPMPAPSTDGKQQ